MIDAHRLLLVLWLRGRPRCCCPAAGLGLYSAAQKIYWAGMFIRVGTKFHFGQWPGKPWQCAKTRRSPNRGHYVDVTNHGGGKRHTAQSFTIRCCHLATSKTDVKRSIAARNRKRKNRFGHMSTVQQVSNRIPLNNQRQGDDKWSAFALVISLPRTALHDTDRDARIIVTYIEGTEPFGP